MDEEDFKIAIEEIMEDYDVDEEEAYEILESFIAYNNPDEVFYYG